MLPDKVLQLLVQPAAELTCRNREVKVFRTLRSEHLIQTFLQSAVIILKGEVQYRAFSDGIVPKRRSRTDMIGKLRHQEALAELGSADKQIRSGIEQTVDKRRSALIYGVVKLGHRYGVKVSRIKHAHHFSLNFLKTIEICVLIGYTISSTFCE